MLIRMMLVALALMLSLTTAQARQANTHIYLPGRVELSRPDGQPATLEQVRKAILMGSQPFGWVVQSEGAGTLNLHFAKKEGHSATVRVDYDEKGYQIKYVSSEALSYEGSGVSAMIHPTYNIWVKNLVSRIRLSGEQVPASAVATPLPQAASR